MSGQDGRRHYTHGRSSFSTGRDDYRDRASASSSSPLPQSPPPKEGDIFEGEIVKIESYGAFCSLSGTRWQGLIHISQLYGRRVEHVEDVVSLNDRVWVKVIQVEQLQQQSRRDYSDRPRLRLKLSMKDVSQDGSRQDLGRQRDEEQQVKTQLESNLNSMIGAAVARDPMENQRLVLKGTSNATNKMAMTFRGGYTLVGDDEGEIPEPESPPTNGVAAKGTEPNVNPLGRGRGATFPAWMTSMPTKDGPIGDRKKRSKNRSSDSANGNDKKKEKRKRDKKSSRRDQKRRSKKYSKKKHRRHSRENSSIDGEDDDYSDCSSSRDGDTYRNDRPYQEEREHSSRSSHDENHRKTMRHHSNNSRHDDSMNSHGGSVAGRRDAEGNHNSK
jgi:predicted RNA-binding protein with RPS1 domain